jgi:hypothetical protein
VAWQVEAVHPVAGHVYVWPPLELPALLEPLELPAP